MSHFDYKNKRLAKEEARRLILKLAFEGKIIYSHHARQRLIERNIILNDVINVLGSNSMRLADGEFNKGGYTYKCSTNKFSVVVGITTNGNGLIVITVFKIEREK